MDSQSSSFRAREARKGHKLMRRMLNALRTRLDEELRPRHVTTAQLRLLYEIQQSPGASGAHIARACGVTPQSAQAMMVLALDHGWILRGKDAENDRLVTARLTPAGVRLLAHAHTLVEQVEAEVWAGIPLAELRHLNALLERGLANLEDA